MESMDSIREELRQPATDQIESPNDGFSRTAPRSEARHQRMPDYARRGRWQWKVWIQYAKSCVNRRRIRSNPPTTAFHAQRLEARRATKECLTTLGGGGGNGKYGFNPRRVASTGDR